MKRNKHTASALALLLATSALGVACSKQPREEPREEPKGLVIQSTDEARPYFHDFGVIQDGTRPSHTFQIKNTEATPITLHDLLPSCSCVVPAIRSISPSGVITVGSTRSTGPVSVVPPDGLLEIEVAIDTQHIRRKNADRLSTIRLRTDSSITPFLTLELHVIVEQLIQATPWEINMGEIPTSAGGIMYTTVIPTSPILDVDLTNAHVISGDGLETNIEIEEQLERKVWRVNAQLSPGLKLGPWNGSIKIDILAPTQDPPQRELIVPVRARIVEDIILRPRRAFLAPANTAGAEFTVQALIPGERITVTSATVSDCPEGLFSSSITPVGPDAKGRAETWKIRVVREQGKSAKKIDARLIVTLSDGEELSAALSSR